MKCAIPRFRSVFETIQRSHFRSISSRMLWRNRSFFTSGDGGWSPFCADVAAHIAATGKTVVGFNSKDYLVSFASSQRPISADELARDYDEMLRAAELQPGVDGRARPVLAGWSLGAGYSVLVASDPSVGRQIDKVVAISLPVYNELAWKPSDALIYVTHGTPREKVLTRVGLLPNSTPSRSSSSMQPTMTRLLPLSRERFLIWRQVQNIYTWLRRAAITSRVARSSFTGTWTKQSVSATLNERMRAEG